MNLGGLVVASTLAWSVQATPAMAQTCAEEATALRAHLVEEQRRATRWNYAWAIGFGAASATQLAFGLAEYKPFGEFDDKFRDTVYVGAAKAAVGLAARLVLPLRIPVPAAHPDPCTDRAALRDALATASRKEQRSFWLTHLGGTALNLAGAAFLTYRHSLATGAISFAISYPVGPASAYSQPRRSWRHYRDVRGSWAVGATAGDTATTLWLAGAF